VDDAGDSTDDDPAAEASAAVDQAAQAVEQAAAERRAREDAAERDEQLARWHDTDRAQARGHHDEIPAEDESWLGLEAGAA
jgi:hypothetical protein